MGGARSRRAGRVERAKRIHGQVVLIFLALGSIGSFLLGHEIAADLAVQAVYTAASQDHLTYSSIALRAGGAVGARVAAHAPRSGVGSSTRHTPGSRARVQLPSGKGGQPRSGLNAITTNQGLKLDCIAMGAEGSLGVPLANPVSPTVASPAVASASANSALHSSDDAISAGTLPCCLAASTDEIGDEATGGACTTAPGAPPTSAPLANPDPSPAGKP